jgi:serine protease Do
LAIGVLSLEAPLEIKGGVLGVLLEERDEGVGIARVMPNSGGQRAGLRRGDVVIKVNGQEMKNLDMMVKTVREHLPGEQVKLEIRRGEEMLSIKAILGRIGDLNPTRQAVPQDKLGGPLSKRRSGFPTVLQHDTVLQPKECGGALVDLNGKAIGINIARAGRISTYALPSSLVVPLIETMKQASKRNEENSPGN